MSGLQRDHTVNEGWTNHEGYNDGTAGAALNNIMRQQRRQTPPTPTKKPSTSLGGTTFIQVEHKGVVTTKPKPKATAPSAQPTQKTPEQVHLKTARTLFTVCTMICRMQGFTIEAITLQDKESKMAWKKSDLEAPQKK